MEGDSEPVALGRNEGQTLGVDDGSFEGIPLGAIDGTNEGEDEGSAVGTPIVKFIVIIGPPTPPASGKLNGSAVIV